MKTRRLERAEHAGVIESADSSWGYPAPPVAGMGNQEALSALAAEDGAPPLKQTPTTRGPRPRDADIEPGSFDALEGLELAGSPFDGALPFQAEMERAFGEDFSNVKVTTGASGAELAGGTAVAQGDEVTFRDSSPSPRVVAHELTHVVQARRHGPTRPGAPRVSDPLDASEREAEAVAEDVLHGGPVKVHEDPSARVQRADGEVESAADRIARVIADEDVSGICALTAEDLASSTVMQRAGMVRILTNLWWTGAAEEVATMRLIEHGGAGSQVLAVIRSLGMIDALTSSIDDEVLAARLASLVGEGAGDGASGPSSTSPAVAYALKTRDSDDVLLISSFDGLDHATLLSLLEILLEMDWSRDHEERVILSILALDTAGLMTDLKALGLKQRLFDHIDSEANMAQLTTMLQALGDPELDADLVVFNRGFVGNVIAGLEAGWEWMTENVSLEKILQGLLQPILHPIDSAIGLLNEALEFSKNPSWDAFIELAQNVTGTVAIWLLEISGVLAAAGALLCVPIVTAEVGAVLLAAAGVVFGWSATLGAAFVELLVLKSVFDVGQAGASTTANELQNEGEDLGQDMTLAAVVLSFMGLFRALKTTLELVRAPAVDPTAATEEGLKTMSEDVNAQQAEGQSELSELQNGSGGAVEGAPPAPEGLTEALVSKRASLTNPNAVKGFDLLWRQIGMNPVKMSEVLANIEKGGNLEQSLEAKWQKSQVPKASEAYGEGVGELPRFKGALDQLLKDASDWASKHPEVADMARLLERIKDQQTYLQKLLSGAKETRPEDIAGLQGNIDGLVGELKSAQGAVDVNGVEQKFPLDQGSVEVDVVADKGSTWIESKNVNPFGKGSTNWAPLEAQVNALLEAAKQNPCNGAPPRVVVQFWRGVSLEVAEALEAMGAEVWGERVQPPVDSGVKPAVEE